jgi:glycine cleavage system aminomethyltransferase T
MKRSALYFPHNRAGASLAEYFGWELPAFFAAPELEAAQIRKTVGLTDLSHFLKFDLNFKPEQRSWRLGAKRYLVVCEPSVSCPNVSVDVTSVYTVLRLVGPKSREVLGKLTSLNVSNTALPNLGCAQASLAHVPGIFLREDIAAIPAFHLLVTRDYAESVWDAILHAGHEFHLCPSGVEALRSLQN